MAVVCGKNVLRHPLPNFAFASLAPAIEYQESVFLRKT